MMTLLHILFTLPGIIIGLTVHEWAHAYSAYLCGDSTAKQQGRLTWNPLKHIDPLGFIFILFMWFGWAKPVEFESKNLKHPENDTIKIALAWPISNVLLALLFTVLFSLYTHFFNNVIITTLLLYTIYINWGLFFFNMIPIPPLDGSHIFFSGLKEKDPQKYVMLYQYGSLLLFVLLIMDGNFWLNIFPISTIVQYWWNFFIRLMGGGV
jgi:Zn-dependent protease